MPARFRPFEQSVFRLNPAYRFIAADKLTSAQKELIGDADKALGFAGVVWPRTGSHSVKAVSPEFAALLKHLRNPAPIPPHLHTPTWRTDVAALVLDSILQIESKGTFLTGPAAWNTLFPKAAPFSPKGHLARLSTEAVQYGQSLESGSIAQLAGRLYAYNRKPLGPHLPANSSDAEFLTSLAPPGSGTRRRLDAAWHTAPPKPEAFWLHWQSRSSRSAKQCYKLYISPDNHAISEAFAAVVRILSDSKAFEFKTVRRRHDLARPDKFVAYFGTAHDLREASARLAKELRGCPAHGVPFTASITADGLLSWAIDPPAGESTHEQMSWRWWIAGRLAQALFAAQREGTAAPLEPWRFALERLRLSGVNPETWRPADNLWGDDAG